MTAMRKHPLASLLRSLARKRDGVAAVEFALVLPLLIVTLFGIIEVGRMMNDFHVVNKSMRDATRYLTRVGVTCDAAGVGNGTIDPGEEVRAVSLAMTGSVVAGGNLLSYWTDTATVTTTVDCIDNTAGAFKGIYAARDYIPRITMSASVPLTFLWGTLIFGSTGLTFNVSHSEVHVGD